MRENSSSGNLKDVCTKDRGVPVSPSSEMEIRFIREQFPEHNVIVAACSSPGQNYQIEPVSSLFNLTPNARMYTYNICQ